MHLTPRRSGTFCIRPIFALILAASFSASIAGPAAPALAADSTSSQSAPAASAHLSSGDAALKQLLQKRLLISNLKNLNLGPPTPGPFPGTETRTVTITSPEGQKVEVQVFADESGTHGIIAQRYAVFDTDHPWEKVDVKALDLKDRPERGPADAPVTIVEFADFECPYCAHAFGEIETLVDSKYKGQVRLIWKNFPLSMHPWAEQAAVAAECARQQNPDAFWSFAHNFYRDQTEITPQNLRQHIDDYTKSLSLDDKVMDACILGKPAETYVQQDMKDGNTVHVNSTPTFVINGVPVIGLPSSDVFDFVVRSQLQELHAGR